MPEYQRKQRTFSTHGMNWAKPIDAIPDDQFALLQNVRAYTDGDLWVRPGLGEIGSFTPTGTTDYGHSISTLLDYNPDTAEGPARFLGFNTDLYWQDNLNLSGATFSLISGSWSGNPQAHIPFTPDGSSVPFMYIYDSSKQRKYSPEYQTVPGTPDEFQIGIPSAYVQYVPIPTSGGAGNLNGSYSYRWVVRDRIRGVRSVMGPASYPATFTNEYVTVTIPTTVLTTDYEYLLYRYSDAVPQWKLVGTLVASPSPANITDNLGDSDILAAETLLTDTADIKFQPFVTPDIDRQGFVTVGAASSTDGSSITYSSGDALNPEWLMGTQISVGGVACTIRRIQSSTVMYLSEDIGALGAGIKYSVTGALQAGKPLGRVWGPYGEGASGLYLFACGDSRSPGTFYWCNGNDPDTVSLANSLTISSPSDPLQNGCVWNGRAYVWSSARMWEIIPSSIPGQFTCQLIPNAHGLFAPWCFCVGDQLYWMSQDGGWKWSGGLPESITEEQLYPFLPHDGKNGITQTLPDPEGSPGDQLTFYTPDPTKPATWRMCWVDGIIYFDYAEFTTGNAYTLVYDTHLMKGGWSLDIYATSGSNTTGYISRKYETAMAPDGLSAPLRTHLICIGPTLFWSDGVDDNGTDITYAIMSGADILGDNRSYKQAGDAVFGATTNTLTPRVRTLIDNNTAQATTATLSASALYTQTVLPISSGPFIYSSRTWGFWIYGTADTTLKLTSFELSFLPRPETTTNRPTDYTDDGYAGAKFLTGVIIKSNVETVGAGIDLLIDASNAYKVSSGTYTFVSGDVGAALIVQAGTGWTLGTYIIQSVAAGAAVLDHSPGPVTTSGGVFVVSGTRSIQLQMDGGAIAAQITLSGPGQFEQAYPITPVVSHQFRLVPLNTTSVQLYSVTYIWIKYPEYGAFQEDYDIQRWPSDKYVRGVAVEGDSQGTTVNLAVYADGATVSGSPLSVAQAGKSLNYYAFGTPFVGKELKVLPLGPWRKHSIRWIYDEYPDFAPLISPWEDGGTPEPKYIKSATIRLDTAGVNNTLTFWADNAATSYTFLVNTNGQKEVTVVFEPPVIAQTFRWAPSTNWRYFKTSLVHDPYPLLSQARTGITGPPRAKYVRGVRITADSSNVSQTIGVQYNGGIVGPNCVGTWNGKSTLAFAFSSPFVAYEMQLVPTGPVRIFESEVEWIFDDYPDLISITTPWADSGDQRSKYMRGGRVRIDTNNLAINATLWVDGAATSVVKSFTANGQTTVDFSLTPPVIARQIRWVPSSPWRFWDTFLDADIYPGLIDQYTPVLSPGGHSAKYIRGMLLTADTSNTSRNFQLLYDGAFVGPLLAGLSFNGKSTQPTSFTPFVAHNIQIVPSGNARIFHDELEFIFDNYPELTPQLSSVMSPNKGHAMFLQGVRITADSNNLPISFVVKYDGGQIGPTIPATSYNGKQTIPFSFQTPFICHNLQLVPSGAVRLFEEEVEWVFEPAPDLAYYWETQPTNHDIPGWHSMVDMWIAYQSAPNASGFETLTITSEYSTRIYYLPVNTTYTRHYLRLNPQKGRWRSYRIDSTLGVRLFVKDCAVRVQPWGNDKDLPSFQPFGDLSRNMGATI